MNGISSLKNTSKAFPTSWSIGWLEALLLIVNGVLAVVLHRAFDTSPGVPGHHGIEWMALMILGRASSRFRGAGTLTSAGASIASVMPGLQGENPFTPMFYLFPGLVMDFVFYYFPKYANKFWFLGLIAGLAHMTKPIGQLTVNLLTGWPFGSFRYGVVVPFSNHFLFGLFGGMLGALIAFGIHRITPKSDQKE